MVLASGAEGFGKKLGGMEGGMRWWGNGIGQRWRRCDDNDAGIPTRGTIFSLTANRARVNAKGKIESIEQVGVA